MRRHFGSFSVAVLLLGVFSCQPARVATVRDGRSRALLRESATLELVESVPIETTLDHAAVRDARELWPQMIASAKKSIELSQFYVANSADADSALEPVLRALEAAVKRQVRVRFLVDSAMSATYPEQLLRLTSAGIELRRFDLRALTSGVSHAKYFIIDDREAFVGSQNFDYRSLAHIHEMGVHLRSAQLVKDLSTLFEHDWALAAGEKKQPPNSVAVALQENGEPLHMQLVYSPKDLSQQEAWELPAIVQLIEQARRSVHIEVLIYNRHEHASEDVQSDGPMARIDAALVAAAARGVTVELLLSDWMRRPYMANSSRALAEKRGWNVRIVTIPQAASGEIPFARLIHAKYVVVDGKRFWLGSSNFEDRYFTRSRNVGIVVESNHLATQLDEIFSTLWNSPYAKPL